MGAASSILASYADVMRGGGNIFCTQKIFTNNSNFRPTLTTAIPQATITTSPVKQEAPDTINTETKKNEGDDNEENNIEGEENENMENEEKENKLAA